MELEICTGKIKVPATVHAIEGFSNGCAIVYYHGGGFCMASVATCRSHTSI